MKKLKNLSNILRYRIIKISSEAKVAHVASCLSCIDIIIFIYEKILKKNNNSKLFYDRFILSKGHAAASIYVMLNHKGIISDKLLSTFNKKNSILEEHPSIKIPGIETSTGALGHGLPVLCGMAYASKLRKDKRKHFIVMGDGECNEGTVWEAALFASSKKLSNLFVFIDFNKWQATGRNNHIINLDSLEKKFSSFGFFSVSIDGHNFKDISDNYKKSLKINKPKVFICSTIKGRGISFMEDDNNWHYKIPNEIEVNAAKKELNIK